MSGIQFALLALGFTVMLGASLLNPRPMNGEWHFRLFALAGFAICLGLSIWANTHGWS